MNHQQVRNVLVLLAALVVAASAADEQAAKPFTRAKAAAIIANARKIVTPNGVERWRRFKSEGSDD